MKKAVRSNHGQGPSVEELAELGRHALDSAHSMINLTSVCPAVVEEMLIIVRSIQAEERTPAETEFEAIFGLLGALSESAVRIEKTMKGMLEFGKGVIFTFENLLVNIFLIDLIETIKARGRFNVNFTYELCPELSEQLCSIDRHQLSDCLFHLIKNAVEENAQTITIATSVETAPEGQFVEISVANDGNPIPQEYLTKIFNLSFTTKQKGNGIGLAQVRRIIEAHGGHIDVRSKSGSTAFRLYLPL
jgi:signal transduction histidine kinase